MNSKITCQFLDKAGQLIKESACELDDTIGYFTDFSFRTAEKYSCAKISDPEYPNIIIYIVGSGEMQYRQRTTHGYVGVAIEVNINLSTNSVFENLEETYKKYLEENSSSFESISLVGGLLGIDVKHVENSLQCNFPYEMYEDPYHYMVDLHSILLQARQIQQILLNIEIK